MKDDCVFCKIVNGDLPSHKLAEDDRTVTILSIDPISEGHTLVIPKVHSDYLWRAEPEDYMSIHLTANSIAKMLQKAFQTGRVVSMVDGAELAHTHLHLIPSDDSITALVKNHKTVEPDHEQLSKVAEKIRAKLG